MRKIDMKNLYAPWRDRYTSSTVRGKKDGISKDDCIFCQQFAEKNNAKHFILRRFDHHAIMFNRYPYNAGHLLIIPFEHVATLEDLSTDARIELIELAQKSSHILRQELGAEGINIGLNMGKAAGAGIPAHLHMHVLPRWLGDTNVMPTIAEVKPISFDLPTMYNQLKPFFDQL